MSTELERVELLARLFASGAAGAPRLELGIGDDAAILAGGAERLVWTIDASVEGVHFRRELLALEDVGFRATMAAASDLAAMGARPLGLLSALVLPRATTDDELERIARGQATAAAAIGAPIIGGNLARGGELSITTTALGEVPTPLRRSGARVGDAIFVAGELGLAAAGFACLERGLEVASTRDAIGTWRRPRARIAEGLSARGLAHAAIDLSDGLARDLGHVARASGVSALVFEDALVSDALRDVATLLADDSVRLALHGGEDYALLITAPKTALIEGFRCIGEIVIAGSSAVSLARPSGVVAVADLGFDHFGDRDETARGASTEPR